MAMTTTSKNGRSTGLRMERRFTLPGIHPYDEIQWERRSAVIGNEKGVTVFEQHDVEVPSFWSQMATNVVVSKYFRGAVGSPQRETSVRQIIDRVVNQATVWGREGHYFASEADAETFSAELTALLLHQKMAFNSPVWFNIGVPGSKPQASACFINSVEDTMDSILTLAHTEGMLFKYGSGSGTNLSPIRSSRENLAGGGTASGPVSFMKGLDAFAGVIKSGGTTRRAAKMAILNVDHPDIEEFITCKVTEERKAWALIDAGYDGAYTGEAYASIFFQNANNSVRVTDEFMQAAIDDKDWQLRGVRDSGQVIATVKAKKILRSMAEAAHHSGDPGIQYDTTINDWHTSAQSGRINASNPCFPGDARVHTSIGLMRIADLYRRGAGGENICVYTHRTTANEPGVGVVATRPLAVMQTGVQPIVRMRFSNGQDFRCTPNHRLWTSNRGWVHAKDLGPSDCVCLNDCATIARDASWALPVKIEAMATSWHRGGTKIHQRLPVQWSIGLGELLGHLVGDGCMTDQQSIWVYGGEDVAEGLAERHATIMGEIFGGVSRSSMANGTYQLRSGSVAVREFLASLGISTAHAPKKRVPEAIFCAPTVVQVAFLRGLFGTDGCVATTENGKASRYVGLSSRSRHLLADVQKLLTTFGIRGRLYDMSALNPNPFTYQRRSGETVTYVMRPGFDLRITGSDLSKFAASIGFSASRKQRRLEEVLQTTTQYRTKGFVRLISCVPDGEELVYNLTEPLHHSYIVDGVLVANCSEFMYLDDTACNLASLNLLKFLNADGSFAVDDFKHAVDLTITAQEIWVSNASYPTPKIADNSHAFRPLGLGYANLGALLMAQGMAYDSELGRKLAGQVTSLMTGQAYLQSARIAAEIGPFLGYVENREDMLRVIGKHREAAYSMDSSPQGELALAARDVWDDTYKLGARVGYRNAQATVLAPTGTISFLMDCDTTGVEPDIALVKYKKLVGGGMLKMVNQTVPAALAKLGYAQSDIADIVEYIDKNDTIEGAPGLRNEHVCVFDCAFKPQNGTRSIAWQGHVRMMAATQPCVSGAISKTVNLPESASVEEVEQAYIDGWKLGLKALAIYRDGSKRSQPLSTSKDGKAKEVVVAVPKRRRLPAERQAVTHRFEVGGHEGYITVGLYEDGTPGEIFLKMAKEGSTISGLMDSFAIAISFGLQHGVPLQALVDKFAHMRFEPQGFTKNHEIPMAKSVIDYIARWMASRFLTLEYRDRVGVIRRDGTELTHEAEQTPAITFHNQSDAPSCAECGGLMTRSGSCYRCDNCGSTSGCS